MATLSVWKFDTPGGADQAEAQLGALQAEGLIQVHDAAVVSWETGKKKPKTRQLQSTTGVGAWGGAFWGLLFGILFFMPLLGVALGAATGALAGSLNDVGIDDGFIRRVQDEITPGTSALFLMSSDAVLDRIKERMTQNPTLLHTNLSQEQESKLREAFAQE